MPRSTLLYFLIPGFSPVLQGHLISRASVLPDCYLSLGTQVTWVLLGETTSEFWERERESSVILRFIPVQRYVRVASGCWRTKYKMRCEKHIQSTSGYSIALHPRDTIYIQDNVWQLLAFPFHFSPHPLPLFDYWIQLSTPLSSLSCSALKYWEQKGRTRAAAFRWDE